MRRRSWFSRSRRSCLSFSIVDRDREDDEEEYCECLDEEGNDEIEDRLDFLCLLDRDVEIVERGS